MAAAACQMPSLILPVQGRLNAFYSTPTEYTLSKYAANVTWTTKV